MNHVIDFPTVSAGYSELPYRVRPKSYRIRWNYAKLGLLRRSRSFKVTDFGTNRKLIYDFLLVINSNLPTVLHRFQVMVQLSLARG